MATIPRAGTVSKQEHPISILMNQAGQRTIELAAEGIRQFPGKSDIFAGVRDTLTTKRISAIAAGKGRIKGSYPKGEPPSLFKFLNIRHLCGR
jgi:hypothetical protein